MIFILGACLLCIQSSLKAQLYVPTNTTIYVAAADNLHVQENLENNGTINHLTLSGGNTQAISGTGGIWHLKVDKSAGTATIQTGMQNIYGTLTPNAGELAAGGLLTLKSLARGTARVVSHATGSVTGTVNVERYINTDNKAKQWRMLGFPFSTNLLISAIGGMGKEFSASTKTMMYFVEGNDDARYGNSGTRNAGYQPYAGTSENILPLTGVMAWLFGPSGTTASTGTMSDSITITSAGTLYETGADVSVPLSYTSGKGWNLVANPFASNIDWTAITKTAVEGSVYRWSPHAADWTSHNGTSGTGPVTTDAIIESGTAFFVRSTGSTPSLTIPQSAKTSTSTIYTHLSKAPFRLDIPGQRVPSGVALSGIRVFAAGPGNPYPGDIYLDLSRTDATPGFDAPYDAWSMGRSSGADVSFLAAEDKELEMQFDRPVVETGKEKRYYPLKVTGIATGPASLTLRTEGNWNALNSVSLIDHLEGKTLLMRGNELRYDFRLESLKTEGRFMLAINHVKLDSDGVSPAFEVKLLGNPVSGDRLDMLVTHPAAKASQWMVLNAAGQQIAAGRFADDAGIQYQLTVTGLRNPGTYILKVQMDNGEERVVPFIHK